MPGYPCCGCRSCANGDRPTTIDVILPDFTTGTTCNGMSGTYTCTFEPGLKQSSTDGNNESCAWLYEGSSPVSCYPGTLRIDLSVYALDPTSLKRVAIRIQIIDAPFPNPEPLQTIRWADPADDWPLFEVDNATTSDSSYLDDRDCEPGAQIDFTLDTAAPFFNHGWSIGDVFSIA